MKYLKLRNIPISIFEDVKYGEKYTDKGSKICWIGAGFDRRVVSALAVQYTTSGGDVLTYLPISNADKLSSVMPLVSVDALACNAMVDDIECSAEIVEDDRSTWINERDS